MFIEMIDSLRCTNDHADSWLVASIGCRDDRMVVQGVLGCPVCLREYPIEDGIAWFGRKPAEYRAEHAPLVAQQEIQSAIKGDIPPDDNAEDGAVRIGAFLSVTEGATVVLGGRWALNAHALSRLLPLQIFALNPTEPIQESEAVGVVMSDEGLPLARGVARGIALDSSTATERTLTTAVHVLAVGGRLVAPVESKVPDGVSVLARDEEFWVGEKRPALVNLIRR